MTQFENMNTSADGTQQVDFHTGFEALHEEHSYWVDEVEGTLPKELRGTFFRNGPGRMKIGERTYGHWFDGPGMISAITFDQGRMHYKNRYVRSPKYLKENQAQTTSVRGYGTQRPGGALSNMFRIPGNPGNTSVVWHGNKCLALYEGGQPYEIDPRDLATKGLYFYDGQLKRSNLFSAHGKIDPRTGYFYNFGMGMTGIGPQGVKGGLDLYKVAPTGRIEAQNQIPLNDYPFLHDFAITENYGIFFISSIVIRDWLKMSLGMCSVADATYFKDDMPVQVLVVDLKRLQLVAQFETDPMCIIHFGNAFEQGDELTVEFMRFTDFETFSALKNVFQAEQVGGAPVIRYRMNLKKKTISSELMSHHNDAEFPTWNQHYTGARNRYMYSLSTLDNGTPGFYNTLNKYDRDTEQVQIHDYGPGKYTSEALFIPKDNPRSEDDGYLASVVYDAVKHLSEVVILDGNDISQVVARGQLRHHVPFGFHGHYTPDTFLK